jgi:hypothetical protein
MLKLIKIGCFFKLGVHPWLANNALATFGQDQAFAAIAAVNFEY